VLGSSAAAWAGTRDATGMCVCVCMCVCVYVCVCVAKRERERARASERVCYECDACGTYVYV
jgi:hypothetical protein